MKKIFSHILQKNRKVFHQRLNRGRLERGQVLVIVTLSVIVLTAIVGLAIDTGLLYLNHGKLRRAVDAAALAATAQFREHYPPEQMAAAAKEFLVLNGINDPSAIVQTCDTNPGDPVLCTFPARKLVRVRATSVVNLTFLSVIGIHQTTITAQAVSEAASMDVVLVIDTSQSMAFGFPELPQYDPMRDPAQCNPGHKCQPLERVKAAAKEFVKDLYTPYDRVSVVTFDNGARVNFSFEDFDNTPDAGKKAAVMAAIDGLGVVDPGVCDWSANPIPPGPCRDYLRYEDCAGDPPVAWEHGNCNGSSPSDEAFIDENFDGIGDFYDDFDCIMYHLGNPSTCGTTNIGKALDHAAVELANPPTFRQEALWVVILLSEGAANSPDYVCPHEDWVPGSITPCRDNKLSRHCSDAGDVSCTSKGGAYEVGANGNSLYDTDDFAHDKADALGEDQEALIFTIGMGDLVRTSKPREKLDASGNPTGVKCEDTDPLDACWGAGELLLRYSADIGRGRYYYAPDPDQLDEIFLDIAQHLATRLTQ
jgi:Flp pilus assembly protein TadG